MAKRCYFKSQDVRKRRPGLWLFVAVLIGGAFIALEVEKRSGGDGLAIWMETPNAQAQEKAASDEATDTTKEKEKKAPKKIKGRTDENDATELSAQDKAAQKRAMPFKEKETPVNEKRYEEARMNEIKDDLTKTLNEMREMQTKLDNRLSEQHDKNQDEQNLRLARLIRVVSGMRPEDSAKLLAEMEEDLAVKILSALNGTRASKVMGNMPPKIAATMSAKMVALKPDPKLKDVLENWKDMAEKAEKADKEKAAEPGQAVADEKAQPAASEKSNDQAKPDNKGSGPLSKPERAKS